MRQDVRLGMAVGGLLVGAVLAYAIFSGPKNKGTDQAGQVARATGSAGGGAGSADGDRAVTPDPATGNGTSAGNSVGAANGANGANAGGGTPPSNEIQIGPGDRGTGAAAAGATGNGAGRIGEIGTGARMPEGRWNWDSILNDGAGSALLPPSETPGPGRIRIDNPGGPLERDRLGSTTQPFRPEPFDPPAFTHDDGPKTYVVRSGETFWTIARDHYGNGGYWSHVARANSRIEPKSLKAGTVINLPARSEVVPVDAPRAVASVVRTLDPTREYRVKSGDSLTVICKALYGKTDPVTIGRLYEANRDLIGPNQNALKLGMVLALPEPPTKVAAVN